MSQGILLGIANVGVVALGMSVVEHHERFALATMIFMIGLVPGMTTGALLGWIAGTLADARVWLRLAWLIVPALLVVVALGELFDLREFIVVSCIPTTVGCLLLEKGTRRRQPSVPAAHARR
jgi:MFS family permease